MRFSLGISTPSSRAIIWIGMRENLVALALLVARVLANDAHHTLPADDPAGITQFFDGRTDFHGKEKERKREDFGPLTPAAWSLRKGPVNETKTPPRGPKRQRGGRRPVA